VKKVNCKTKLPFLQAESIVIVTAGQTGFIQTLESPEIKMLIFPGLESPGKRHRSWKTLKKSWNSKVVVLRILLSRSSIAP